MNYKEERIDLREKYILIVDSKDLFKFPDGYTVYMSPENIGELSDGYHTFNELYEHRSMLFITLCMQPHVKRYAWRSKLHNDGSMFDGMFILGIFEEPGTQITYHLDMKYWDMCGFITTLEKAPKFDGHTSKQVLARLMTL